MRTVISAFMALFTLCLLISCAEVGVTAPQTFNQRLAAGYTSVTTVRQATITLLQAKKITPKDAQTVQDQTDSARVGLDLAAAMSVTDLKAAENRLTVSLELLRGLQTYLNSRSI